MKTRLLSVNNGAFMVGYQTIQPQTIDPQKALSTSIQRPSSVLHQDLDFLVLHPT
jgi:hypothetical protein